LQIAVEKYEEMFPAFSDSRECKLLKVGGEERGVGGWLRWGGGMIC
jgi:hypothetical protein